MDNKSRMKMGAEVLALFIWGMSAIATFSTVLNAKPAKFFYFAAAVNLAVTAYAIFRAAKKVSAKYEKPEEKK